MSRAHTLLLIVALAASGCVRETPYELHLPPGFPQPNVPEDNALTVEKVELGRHLFYDKRLSANGTQAWISPQSSQVSIYVFRGGKFSRLGHNHVMTSQHLTGRVWVHPEFARSGFELSFPVAQLVVDDAEARRAAGSDFPPDIPQSDKDGTRKNMLRPEVLDAEQYAEVKLRSARIGGTLEAPQVTAHITIKDASHDVEVPVKIAIEGAQLTASGEFDILQTQFGMKPFSVALGALEVQDRLHLKFKVTAMHKQ